MSDSTLLEHGLIISKRHQQKVLCRLFKCLYCCWQAHPSAASSQYFVLTYYTQNPHSILSVLCVYLLHTESSKQPLSTLCLPISHRILTPSTHKHFLWTATKAGGHLSSASCEEDQETTTLAMSKDNDVSISKPLDDPLLWRDHEVQIGPACTGL